MAVLLLLLLLGFWAAGYKHGQQLVGFSWGYTLVKPCVGPLLSVRV